MRGGPAPRSPSLCGPGNNGGDGFVAARLLREQGYRVRLGLLGSRDALKGDAADDGEALGRAGRAARRRRTLADADLIIDALFGAGLSRPLAGHGGRRGGGHQRLRQAGLAVDVPSGLDGTTGAAAGPVVQATRTVTFFRLKPGHLLLPGRALCGEVRLADIGIPDAVLAGDRARAPSSTGRALWRRSYPWPRLDGHKYTRGHAVVVSGPAESTGRRPPRRARRLCASAPGSSPWSGPATATAINATHLTAIMVKALGSDAALAEFLSDVRRNAVLIGPGAGVGAATAATVLTVLASPAAAVLDADALTSFAPGESEEPCAPRASASSCAAPSPAPAPDGLFAAIKARAAPVVLTPHEGEFKRLFGELRAARSSSAPAAAAELSGAVVILKGADTVIAAPDGRAAINDNAPPWLATAGAGDVLAGFVTGPAGAAHAGLRGRLRRRLAARRLRQPRSGRA